MPIKPILLATEKQPFLEEAYHILPRHPSRLVWKPKFLERDENKLEQVVRLQDSILGEPDDINADLLGSEGDMSPHSSVADGGQLHVERPRRVVDARILA